jgi:hypothetical protein
MKNYNLKNALQNIATNKRGHYYGLMIITAVLGYFGTMIANLGDTPEKLLYSGILATITAMVQEAMDYINDNKE